MYNVNTSMNSSKDQPYNYNGPFQVMPTPSYIQNSGRNNRSQSDSYVFIVAI